MLLAVSAQGKDLDAEVDPRFGRASHFLLVDTDTMDCKVVANSQNMGLAQGAGIQAAQNVLAHKPEAVITGNCGPKAFTVLQTAGVKVIVGVSGGVRAAITDYLAGRYTSAGSANVAGHWG